MKWLTDTKCNNPMNRQQRLYVCLCLQPSRHPIKEGTHKHTSEIMDDGNEYTNIEIRKENDNNPFVLRMNPFQWQRLIAPYARILFGYCKSRVKNSVFPSHVKNLVYIALHRFQYQPPTHPMPSDIVQCTCEIRNQ